MNTHTCLFSTSSPLLQAFKDQQMKTLWIYRRIRVMRIAFRPWCKYVHPLDPLAIGFTK